MKSAFFGFCVAAGARGEVLFSLDKRRKFLGYSCETIGQNVVVMVYFEGLRKPCNGLI